MQLIAVVLFSEKINYNQKHLKIMKSKFSLFYFAILFLIVCNVNAQCPPAGDIYLNSQAELDTFVNQYPTCTTIDGKLTLQGDVNDITALENLTQLNGLIVQNSALTSLEGLNNLSVINGDLKIGPNSSLTNINALSQLTTVNAGNGGIIIQDNEQLVNLVGLQNITTARYITISENASLLNLDGLQGLETLSLRLQISHVPNLQSLAGLDNFSSVDNLTIQYCPALETLEGLNELAVIQSYLGIHHNPELAYCHIEPICNYLDTSGSTNISYNSSLGCASVGQINDFCEGFTECPDPGNLTFESQYDLDYFLAQYPSCTTIQGNVTIIDDDGANITNLNGLQNITTITGSLTISANYGLSTLGGLENLEQIGGTLMIINNGILESLEALSNLTNLNNSEIRIENNGILTSLAGLDNIDPSTISNLILRSSQNLTTCNVASICNYVAGIGNTYTISGNATNCNSDVEIIDSCQGILPECPSDFTFLTQAEVDHYKVRYPNCTEVNGDLIIGGTSQSDIDDLTPLNHIDTVDGILKVSKTSLNTLAGLENISTLNSIEITINSNLTSIQGLTNLSSLQSLEIISNTLLEDLDGIGSFANLKTLKIVQNPALTDISGLSNLHTIENGTDGSFEISDNENLPNLDGLENLSIVDGFLKVNNNNNLLNIDGLSAIQTVGYNLNIKGNPLLETIGLENLTTVGSLFYLGSNTQLQSLEGLENLTSVPSFDIIGNHSLTNLEGLSGLETVNNFEINDNDNLISLNGIASPTIGHLTVSNNDLLTDIQSLNSTRELSSLTIVTNASLESLEGLNSLAVINGDFILQDNERLNSLEALLNLNSVQRIWLQQNNALESLSGLDNINPNVLSNLILESSINLATCNVASICTYLTNGGDATISGNATGCQSEQEILDNCTLGTDSFNNANAISVHPNPLQDWLFIETTKGLEINEVTIYDVSGKLIVVQNNNPSKISTENLSKGLYFLTVKTNNGQQVFKLVK